MIDKGTVENSTSRGLFIAVEGADGAGKSTQLALMKEFFKSHNLQAVFTREPGGTPIGEKIRDVILDADNSEMCHMTEALLYAASRAQHVSQLIVPNVTQGIHVITDRFVDSSLVYQGLGRNLGSAVEEINSLAVMGCMPDFTIFIDLDPEYGRLRIEEGRGEKDRLELEADSFHRQVYMGYKALIDRNPDRYRVIDGRGTIEEVWSRIEAVLKAELKMSDY